MTGYQNRQPIKSVGYHIRTTAEKKTKDFTLLNLAILFFFKHVFRKHSSLAHSGTSMLFSSSTKQKAKLLYPEMNTQL